MTDENLKMLPAGNGQQQSYTFAEAVWDGLYQLQLEVSCLKLQLQLLRDENRQLQDTVDANEEREKLLKAQATSRGGRVPQ